MDKIRLSKYKLFEMAYRSFFIQSCWNFDKMQNLGFVFSLSPALKRIFTNKSQIQDAIKRHLSFFNSQPYLSVFAVGAIAQMEEKGEGSDSIEAFKKSLIGPLGAIGDTFFWASLRPTIALLALCFAFIGKSWAPIVFIILYNIPHVYIRFQGVRDGYALGPHIIEKLKYYKFYEKANLLRDIGIILVGYIAGISLFFSETSYLTSYSVNPFFGIIILALVIFFASLLKFGITPIKILCLLVVFSILASYLYFLI